MKLTALMATSPIFRPLDMEQRKGLIQEFKSREVAKGEKILEEGQKGDGLYVMLAGINDSDQHARELVRCLEGVPAKVNLIPFNPFPKTRYLRSSNNRIHRFFEILNGAGIVTITRKTRGDDIDAACGQLAGQFQDRTRRRVRSQTIKQVAST